MARLLFVDDDLDVLAAMRRVLRREQTRWDMVFVASPAAALTAFADAPFDVVVSDMMMPKMTGRELLTIVRDRYPDTIRIVLSGSAEGIEVSEFAHHMLPKPCPQGALRDTIASALSIRNGTPGEP